MKWLWKLFHKHDWKYGLKRQDGGLTVVKIRLCPVCGQVESLWLDGWHEG